MHVVRFEACLAATFTQREDFAWIQRALRIECTVDAAHEIEIGVGEEKRHQFTFFHTDAVLAGEAAADLDAVANDFGGCLHGALELFVVAQIVENDGMKIAVAGMEDVADVESELSTDFLDAAERLRKFRTRDDAVEDVDPRGDAAECAEGILATFPEQLALFVVAGHADFARFVGAADFVDGGGLRGDGFQHAFDFEEKDGAGIHGKAGVDVIFDDAKGPAVEHFASGRRDAAGGNVGHGFARVVDGFENGEKRFDGFGFAGKFYGDFGDESERAFGANEEAGEIVGARIALLAADADNFAGGEHEFERGDVIGGDSVGERVRAAGIFGDVTADGGRFLAGGIGSEVEPGMLDGACDVEIYDARLDDGALIVEIEFEDAIHTGENKHESARTGERATREAGAGTTAEDWDAVLRGDANDLGDFGGRRGKNDNIGPAFFDGAVVFVEDEVFGAGENGGLSEDFLQSANQVAMRLRIRRWWDAGHVVIRVPQMTGCGEMTWTYIGEELSERNFRSVCTKKTLNR